jgi:hypothetical protein
LTLASLWSNFDQTKSGIYFYLAQKQIVGLKESFILTKNQIIMKRLVTALFVFFLVVNYSCMDKIDYEKEKAAIIAVMEEETASYYASDFERWSATYLEDSTAIRMGSSKSGYSFTSGWESISANMKQTILNKREPVKEVKNYKRIKVYEESAWVVFDNIYVNSNGEATGNQLTTCFLEKHDDTWKIVFRNVVVGTTYYQADIFLVMAISYAKSIGKNVEDIAGFIGDNVKSSWNQATGFNGLVNGMLSNWRAVAPKGELKIMEQDDNHIVFIVNKMFPALKNAPQYNVSYDEYLLSYRVACERISDYMGGIYKQETTPDGLLITISKKTN